MTQPGRLLPRAEATLPCARRRRVYAWSVFGLALTAFPLALAVMVADRILLLSDNTWQPGLDYALKALLVSEAPVRLAIRVVEDHWPGRPPAMVAGLVFAAMFGWNGALWVAGAFWAGRERARVRWLFVGWAVVTLPCMAWLLASDMDIAF